MGPAGRTFKFATNINRGSIGFWSSFKSIFSPIGHLYHNDSAIIDRTQEELNK